MNRNKTLEELNKEIDVYIQNAQINEKQQIALENKICELTKQLKNEKLKLDSLQNEFKQERSAKQSLANQLRLSFYYAWPTGNIIDIYYDSTNIQMRVQVSAANSTTATCHIVNTGDVVYIYRNPYGDCGAYHHYLFFISKTQVWGNILTLKDLFVSFSG